MKDYKLEMKKFLIRQGITPNDLILLDVMLELYLQAEKVDLLMKVQKIVKEELK